MTDFLKVYLAGSWAAKESLRGIRDELARDFDFLFTSRWLDTEEPYPSLYECGVMDLQDVDKADAMIVFGDTPSTSGGYHVEYGYMLYRVWNLGYGTIYYVGERTSPFHHLLANGEIVVCASLEELRAILEEDGWKKNAG